MRRRLRRVWRTIASASATSGQDQLQHAVIQSARRVGNLRVQAFQVGRWHPQPTGPKRKSVETPLPLAGSPVPHPEGLEQAIPVLQTLIDDLDQIPTPAIDQHPQRPTTLSGKAPRRHHWLGVSMG